MFVEVAAGPGFPPAVRALLFDFPLPPPPLPLVAFPTKVLKALPFRPFRLAALAAAMSLF